MKGSKIKKQPTAKVNNTRRQFWQCARKVQAWGPQHTIAREHMFSRMDFKPEKVLQALAQGASPKIVKLLEKIKELDAADMKESGHLFKHFIYSDVDEASYGARMVISALVASGYTNMIPDVRTILPPTGDKEKRTFVYLSSKPVQIKFRDISFDGYTQAYDLSGNELYVDENKNIGLTGTKLYRPSMKNYVTQTFNAPSNKYGDHIRFIVLDRKFKEGLDLFDVKYAHLMEAMSPSETKQAEGRGTRNCGQKNLPFTPNVGWTLHVYHYLLRMPKAFATGLGFNEKYEDLIKNASDTDQSVEFLTDKFTQLSIEQALDRPLALALEAQYIPKKGGRRGGMTLRSGKTYENPVRYTPRKSRQVSNPPPKPVQPSYKPVQPSYKPVQPSYKPVQPSNPKPVQPSNPKPVQPSYKPAQLAPERMPTQNALAETDSNDYGELWDGAADVGSRLGATLWDGTKYVAQGTKDVGSRAISAAWRGTKHVAARTKDVGSRATLAAWQGTKHVAARTRDLGSRATLAAWQGTKNKTYRAWEGTKGLVSRAWHAVTRKKSPPKALTPSKSMDLVKPKPNGSFEETMNPPLVPVTDAQIDAMNIDPPLSEFQRKIARTFGHANLPKLPLENACVKKDEKKSTSKQGFATLNMTQDFLRRFVTPVKTDTPVMETKGILLWHSTGSGKTCTAVSIASNFEENGYLIVYVCPSSLTSEIKKNVWDSSNICHFKNLRENWGHLQDIDSMYDASWLGGPMGYKTFTNLVKGLAGKGGGSQVLKTKLANFDKKHGITASQRQADPFYRMLLIIDEAQKLYSNELGPIEQPHMPTVETYLHQSYAKNEADPTYPCARVVLMTATPISKSPFELFQLLNLIRPKKDALPITMPEFKGSTLVNEKGDPKDDAIRKKLEGYISYLDLSNNRTRFAQKVHHMVEVPISGTYEPTLPPLERKPLEEAKHKLVATKLAKCKGTKTACAKQVKLDPEIVAIDAQLASRPKTKKKYDKTKDFTQLAALQECASKYLVETPKVDFYPSENVGPKAGYTFIRDGPKGTGYYAVVPEPPEKVAAQVVESIDNVRSELERALGHPVKVETDFVAASFPVAMVNLKFPGWTYRNGPKGKGYYVTNFKGETFVPSDQSRNTEGYAGWAFRRSKEGLGYYATTLKQAIKRRIANRLNLTPRKSKRLP